MELKLLKMEDCSLCYCLLIVPYGIETLPKGLFSSAQVIF